MSDADLLLFGTGVTFIALAGAYLILRARFAAHGEVPLRGTARRDPVPVPVVRAPSRAAR
jgi:hypothetical protein